MNYWVYENYIHNKAVVHRAGCSYCNSGMGIHMYGGRRLRDHWHGPFDNSVDAQDFAKNTGRADVRGCKVCAP